MLDRYDVNYPRVLLIGLIVAVGLAMIVAASTTSTAFGIYNPSWEGASDLRQQADAVDAEPKVALNTSAYETAQANETAAVILSPEQEYSQEEQRRIRRFVRQGGTLVIADDFGTHTNPLLRTIGVSVRIKEGLLRDEQRNYRSPALPVATNVTNTSLTTGVNQLTLNYGTVLQEGNATVLVRSSEFSYIDQNRNGNIDANETIASRPIAARESVGRGRVIVVSDASMFINSMLDRPGNQQFVRNIFDSEEQVLLDYSHTSAQPPLAVALFFLRQIPALQALCGVLGLGVVGLWSTRERFFNWGSDDDHSPTRVQPSDDALVSYLQKLHPEWEESRLRRVMTGIISERPEGEDNE